MAPEMKKQREDTENAEAPLGNPFYGFSFGEAYRIFGAIEVGEELSQEKTILLVRLKYNQFPDCSQMRKQDQWNNISR